MSTVPVGSIVTRIYWRVPEWHGYGPDFDDHADACRFARERKDELWDERLIDPPRVWIAQRWTLALPDGGTVDLTVERTEFAPTETRETREWQRWKAAQAASAQTEGSPHAGNAETPSNPTTQSSGAG